MSVYTMKRIGSVNGYIKWVSQFKIGRYLYRGVSNDYYEIESSIYRRPRKGGLHPKELVKVTKRLIQDARVRGHGEKNGRQLSDLELLAELQHSGAATCLIDFTQSPLVALWFACQQSSKGESNGRIFAVRTDAGADYTFKKVTPESINSKIEEFFKPDEYLLPQVYEWQPKPQNQRIMSQHSVFLLNSTSIEETDSCIINRSAKTRLLEFLSDVCHVSEATLFPDFQGFANQNAHDKSATSKNDEFLLSQGMFACHEEDFETSISHFDELIGEYLDLGLDLHNYPIVAAAYQGRGKAYRLNGDYESALDSLKTSLDISPDHFDDGWTYVELAMVYKAQQDYNNAIKCLSKSLETHSYICRGKTYWLRAILHYELHQWQNAIKDFKKAIELTPEYEHQLPRDIAQYVIGK